MVQEANKNTGNICTEKEEEKEEEERSNCYGDVPIANPEPGMLTSDYTFLYFA